MTVETRMDDFRDQFPVGMRVLAVDDDPTCLMVLETLLRRCQYHVTTTNQAITALNLLRENKDKFDLVISDVHMPDMDGFKLLELVGLEMDLPVIMLSAYGDTKLVMKGITHGACDYLLKPVRMEELKNIWQHVIRRKKFDSSNHDKPHSGSDNGLGSAGTSNTDQKMTKKRKDHDEDEDEDRENEDPATQKKRRVVWTGELHRKFVAAVHHLGIDKAVPKKILDLMNVENLTRENVASHLQKFRLYLKRISCMTNQQANLVAALGTPDQSYLRMNSLSGLRQFQNNSLRSFSPTGVIGRFNTPAGLRVHGLPSSRNFQLAHAQNFNNSMNDPLSFHSTTIHGSSIQGIPMCARPDQLQHHKSNINSVHDLTDGGINDKTIFPITSEPPDPTITGRSFRNTQLSVDSQDSEFCLSQLDYGRCSDNWSDAVQSSRSIHANSYPPSGSSRQIALPPTPTDAASSIALLSAQSHDASSQEAIFMNPTRNISSNVPPFQGWDDRNQDATYRSNSDVFRSSMNSMIPVNDAVTNLDFNFGGVANSAEEILLKQNEGYIMDPQKAEQSCFSNIQGSLDLEDLVTEMLKQDHQDELKLLDGDFLCNNYSPEISM